MTALHHGGMHSTHTFTRAGQAALLALACAMPLAQAQAADTTAALQMQRWSDASGGPVSAERGRFFFTSRHGGAWSCASCHGNWPTAAARHATTDQAIAPLAPAFQPGRFTDTAQVDQWFHRNCQDVLNRECSAAEKADVLAWLLSLGAPKPPATAQGKP